MAESMLRPDASNCWYGDNPYTISLMPEYISIHLQHAVFKKLQGVVYAESNSIGIPGRRMMVPRYDIVLLASSRMGRSSVGYAMPEKSLRDLEPDCLAHGSCPLCSCGCPTALCAYLAAFDTLSLPLIDTDNHWALLREF